MKRASAIDSEALPRRSGRSTEAGPRPK